MSSQPVEFFHFPPSINASGRLVYLLFAANANAQGLATLTRLEISRATGVSETTVGDALVGLEKSGLIERVGKDGRSITYAIQPLPKSIIRG